MIRALFAALFGRYCRTHQRWYRSDFCPQHVKAMNVRFETHSIVNREYGRSA